ncbi:MAG: metallophosphoesterase [Eubacteriales bacterium]|nr:metallophosphoesterase [Eubacteriales bacterium]
MSKTFRTKSYKIQTHKVTDARGARFAVLTDLHGLVFGKNHSLLLQAIRSARPDAVLILGDMIVRSECSSFPEAESLLFQLAGEFRVYYALGNHEYKLLISQEHRGLYLDYEKRLTEAGICFLHNEHAPLEICGTDYTFYGLELPIEYYGKPFSPKLSLGETERLLGKPAPDSVNILMAHNPKYGDTYFSWGADLILSGHYHGGILRFNENHGLACPQYLLFPPYCCGAFHRGEQHMIVSAGLGEHTIPVRIHNPRELIIVTVSPKQTERG